MLEEKALDPGIHDRGEFHCGSPELDDYLQRLAGQHRRAGVSNTYVLINTDQPRRILGYYTLSAASVDRDGLPPMVSKRLPRYPIPCFRMGRLACDQDVRGQGYGRLLMGLAVDRCLAARESVAAFALVVDAKDEAARSFYLHYGFVPISDTPMTLYLPLSGR